MWSKNLKQKTVTIELSCYLTVLLLTYIYIFPKHEILTQKYIFKVMFTIALKAIVKYRNNTNIQLQINGNRSSEACFTKQLQEKMKSYSLLQFG